VSAGSPQVRAAALIRADIRKAVEDEALGVLPPGISFSVRAADFATAPGVTITIYGDGEWIFAGPQRTHLTAECAALRRKLTKIAGRHWQPPEGGFSDVDVIGGAGGGGRARGSISGHPKRKD
jgi:hypothetical protein